MALKCKRGKQIHFLYTASKLFIKADLANFYPLPFSLFSNQVHTFTFPSPSIHSRIASLVFKCPRRRVMPKTRVPINSPLTSWRNLDQQQTPRQVSNRSPDIYISRPARISNVSSSVQTDEFRWNNFADYRYLIPLLLRRHFNSNPRKERPWSAKG